MYGNVAVDGVHCTLDLKVGGESVGSPLTLQWSESMDRGSEIMAVYEADDGPDPKLGDPVELAWTSDIDPRTEGKLKLWCGLVTRIVDGGPKRIELLATDPLCFCVEEPQFRSYAGHSTISSLAQSVLAFQPGKLQGMSVDGSHSRAVPADYILQCGESGAEFLRRVAAMMGAVTFWRRDRLFVADVGKPPGEKVRLEFAKDLIDFSTVTAAQPALAQVRWLDPASRKSNSSTVKLQDWSGASGVKGLSRPARTSFPPDGVAWESLGVQRDFNGTVRARTTHAGLSLGSIVELPGGDPACVESISHFVDGGGLARSYSNTLSAVPKRFWGMSRRRAGEALLGPFQATVEENDDPQRMGRIRVSFSEDPERRVTPWIPVVTPAAGKESGVFWMPEKKSIVLVVAPVASPESLIVLGAIRGEDQTIAASWKSADNAHKALAFRNGLHLIADDKEGRLQIETSAVTWEIDNEGHLKLKAQTLHGDLTESAAIKAGQSVDIDAVRINLGT
jgi:uncharacterized protein involved in type VI secretion and phage assembly